MLKARIRISVESLIFCTGSTEGARKSACLGLVISTTGHSPWVRSLQWWRAKDDGTSNANLNKNAAVLPKGKNAVVHRQQPEPSVLLPVAQLQLWSATPVTRQLHPVPPYITYTTKVFAFTYITSHLAKLTFTLFTSRPRPQALS